MNKIFLFFTLIISGCLYGQDSKSFQPYLALDNVQIKTGDCIEVQNLKNIQVVSSEDITLYQLQFVIVPFQGTLLSFMNKANEIKNLDIDYYLNVGSISQDKIKHIILNIRKDENSPVLYSTTIFTRKLITAEDYFIEFTLHASIGDGESAIWCINQAVSLDSKNLTYLNAKAQLMYEMGDINSAKTEFEKIINSQPNHTSYYYLSLIEINQSNFSKGESYAQLALDNSKHNDERSNSYLLLGNTNSSLSNFNLAYDAYLKSIEYNPKNVLALNNIIPVLDKINRSNEKLKYYKLILEVDSTKYLFHINIGFDYLKKEQYELALHEFEYVLKIDPFQGLALNNKAFALLKMGKLNDALAIVDEAIRVDPSNSYAFRNKALILIELKEIDKACQNLEKAISLNFTKNYGDEVEILIKKYCK
jgi:tetratricopeptide (TPR) repeat protein